MKAPIRIWIILNIIVWGNYLANKPQQDFELKCKVISKNTQDKLSHHKNYTTSEGYRRTFLVYNERFGYGEVPTAINTYMTTKEGEMVTFDLDREDVAVFFGRSDLPSYLIYNGWFIALSDIIIIFLWVFASILPAD